MGLFYTGHRYIMQLFILHLVSGLALLCNIALAQFDITEAVTGSTSFPDVAITCLGNLGVFIACLVRGRLHAEMGVKDVLDTIKGSKLHEIDEFGLTTCRYNLEANGAAFVLDLREAQVVMLSNQKPNSSMRNFMKYTLIIYGVPSIQLLSFPLDSDLQVAAEIRNCCQSNNHACNCIVFKTKEDITTMLAEQMPGTLKELPHSKCLLPCLACLRNGCHGCNQNLWPVGAACQILDEGAVLEEPNSCICIPTHHAEDDEWTQTLIRSLKTKDKDNRGVITLASEALKNYIAQSGICDAKEEYFAVSLIVPRVAEALVNIILTGWLRVDGFSAALLARRAVKDYIVDCRGSGIAGNAFFKKSWVYSNPENTSVCQVLTFRGALLSFGTLSFIIGAVNLICSVTWALLVALEGGPSKWYEPLTPAPSKLAVDFIMVAICIHFVILCLECFINGMAVNDKFMPTLHNLIFRTRNGGKDIPANIAGVSGILQTTSWFVRWSSKNGTFGGWLLVMMAFTLITALEIGCMVLGLRGHLRDYGRWIYGALRLVVWMKWAYYNSFYPFQILEYNRFVAQMGINIENMNLSYACVFLQNAVFVGVRGKWKYLSS